MNAKKAGVIFLIVNIVLLGVNARWYSELKKLDEEMSQTVTDVDTAEPEERNMPLDNVSPKPAAEPVSAVAQSERAYTWETVESADYQKYIANLRAIGCPESTIHDIIRADVNSLFADKKKQSRKPYEYWKTGNFLGQVMDQEKVAAHQEINKQKNELLKTLLGPDVEVGGNLMAERFNPLEPMIDFLPYDKQADVMNIMENLQAKVMNKLGGGRPDAKDLEDLREIRADMDAQISAMMTPEEQRQFELRASHTSQMMRMSLGDFNPSREEFEAIYDLRKPFDEEHSVFGIPAMDPAGQEARKAAEKQFNEDVKNLLGEDRFKEFERAPRQEYKSALKVTERLGLEPTVAATVWDDFQAYEDSRKSIRENNSLTADQKSQQRQQIEAAMQENLLNLLGEKGYEAYRNQNGWARNLGNSDK